MPRESASNSLFFLQYLSPKYFSDLNISYVIANKPFGINWVQGVTQGWIPCLAVLSMGPD